MLQVLDRASSQSSIAMTATQVEAVEQYVYLRAAESLWVFRQLMNPNMKVGWFQRELAKQLRAFYDSMVRGEAPVMVLEVPPQHGKSLSVLDFIAWVLGKQPSLQTIFTSFSDRLSIRSNLRTQRALDSVKFKRVFPDVSLAPRGSASLIGLRNTEMLELIKHGGSFRNTTVRGAVTGESLDLGVIDDPIKGRAEAQSDAERDKVWNWFTDDFFTRFSEHAALLLIMTRWHLDDMAGRLIEMMGDRVRIVRWPALAEVDEPFRKQGEPLFPEHKSLDFLLKRKSVMLRSSWESVYQQNPIIVGGGVFPIDKLRTIPVFDRAQIVASVRYVDKAGTKDGAGARTAMVLMHKMKNGTFVVEDVNKGRWAALERETELKSTVKADTLALGVDAMYRVVVEQEPGSGGKESAEATVRNLAGYSVYVDKVTGSKELRAEPFAVQVQAGNVVLVAGPWNKEYLGELEAWPNGALKDQVDASSGAFNTLVGGSKYVADLSWVY